MALSTLKTDPLKDEVRIILVGKTGAGKSATGNTILGEEKFESLPLPSSVTQSCDHASTKRYGKYLQIVDAPGYLDKQATKEETMKRISQWVVHLSPGIHAILFVMRIGRYTEEDVQTVKDFIINFGPLSRKYVIAVFTGADDLSEKCDLQTYIKNADDSLKTCLDEINNRYIAVNNKLSFEKNNTFVETLLTKIEDMQRENGGSYYTCEMFEKAEEHIKKVEAKKLKEIEEENREIDIQTLEEAEAIYKAELDNMGVKKEERDELIAERVALLRDDIHQKHLYEARIRARKAIALTFAVVTGISVLAEGAAITVTAVTCGWVVALVGAACLLVWSS